MKPNLQKLPLIMQNIEVDSFDSCDPVVDGWMRLLAKWKKIWFEVLFKNDVDGRKEIYIKEEKGKGKRKCKGKEKENKGDVGSSDEIKHLMESGFKTLDEMFAGLDQSVNSTISSLHGRLHSLNGRLVCVEEMLNLPNAEEAEAKRRQEEEEARRLAEEEEALRKQEEEAKRHEEEEARRQAE